MKEEWKRSRTNKEKIHPRDVLPDKIRDPFLVLDDTKQPMNIKELFLRVHPVQASPYCSSTNPLKCDHDHTLWPWAVFTLIIVSIGVLFLWFGGQITGEIRVDVKYITPFVWFGWIAIVSGLAFLIMWVIYFYGGIWKRDAFDEIEREKEYS